MAEKILGVIRLRAGVRAPTALFFSSNRLIVAKTVGGKWRFALASFGVWGEDAADSRAKQKAEKLRELSPESILKADKNNFAIPYSDITKVEMKKGGRMRGSKLKVFTDTKKYDFRIFSKRALAGFVYREHKEIEDQVNLVRSVLSDRLSVS